MKAELMLLAGCMATITALVAVDWRLGVGVGGVLLILGGVIEALGVKRT